jgi:hypothetical protein
MKRKELNAIAAFAKLLVLMAIFLLAINANAFTSLSPVSGNQVQMNHLIEFEKPMNKPTHNTTYGPTNELSNDLWQCQMEIGEMNSKKKSQPRGLCQDKNSEQVTFSKQEKDAELPYHLLPKHIQQAVISNALSLKTSLLPHSSWLLYQSQASTQEVHSRFLREHLNHLIGPRHSQQS